MVRHQRRSVGGDLRSRFNVAASAGDPTAAARAERPHDEHRDRERGGQEGATHAPSAGCVVAPRGPRSSAAEAIAGSAPPGDVIVSSPASGSRHGNGGPDRVRRSFRVSSDWTNASSRRRRWVRARDIRERTVPTGSSAPRRSPRRTADQANSSSTSAGQGRAWRAPPRLVIEPSSASSATGGTCARIRSTASSERCSARDRSSADWWRSRAAGAGVVASV